MTEHYPTLAAQALERMQAQSHFVYLGRSGEYSIDIRWDRSEHKVVFSVNWGSRSGPPTRPQAQQALQAMRDMDQSLRTHSPEFQVFMQEKITVYNLCVFSGPMDFDLAEMDADGNITWLNV